jgi:periplasmic protein TonB
MDFAQRQRNPTRHLVGLTFVILLHVFVIYALVTGLARNVVEVIKKPLTATIIEEVKLPPPPPPPPPKKIIEPPKVQAPVEPYVPPPDIPVPTPPSEPVISAPTTTVPTEQHVIAPPVQAPAPKPAIRKGITPLVKVDPIYPREAIRAGIAKGRVVARLFIDEKGLVSEVRIVESDPPGVFNKEVTRALSQWKFQAEGEKFVGEVELTFTLKDE